MFRRHRWKNWLRFAPTWRIRSSAPADMRNVSTIALRNWPSKADARGRQNGKLSRSHKNGGNQHGQAGCRTACKPKGAPAQGQAYEWSCKEQRDWVKKKTSKGERVHFLAWHNRLQSARLFDPLHNAHPCISWGS